jgi:acyl-CoA synthetase (NDP forming)
MALSLSEHESKNLLAQFGVSIPDERLVLTPDDAVTAARDLGVPVALKLCGAGIAHKTERNLVRLSLASDDAVRSAADELFSAKTSADGDAGLLVCPMASGRRELIVGMIRDPQFGPCVMLGLGGIFAEVLSDVAFAVAPLAEGDAESLMGAIEHPAFLDAFRGEPAVDRPKLRAILDALGRIGTERPDVLSIDINPLIISDAEPVVVDALVELDEAHAVSATAAAVPKRSSEQVLDRLAPLFHPKGIIVTGVSEHPGKFGTVAYHNILACGFEGEIFAINRAGAEIFDRPSYKSIDEIPDGSVDLVVVCTPTSINEDLLRAAAAKGARAAFIASGGYGESSDGQEMQTRLVALADELGMAVAGPNGQGVISTEAKLCAQIVAPYPPPGPISVVSQSGNIASSYMNYACIGGVGISKAVSCGNAAQLTLADYLEYYAIDPATAVSLVYLEGVGSDGRRFLDVAKSHTELKPLVLVRGGVTNAGKTAASSHTGSLASDENIFAGVCRQAGITRAATVEEAYEAAATFASQPLPRGPRTVIFTVAGGWGVLTADECIHQGLELIDVPEDLKSRIDEMVPSRWSRSNPIDLAGGETRDTIPQVIDMIAAHDDVDAVIYLGMGIQAAQAHLFKSGPFHPDHGIGRIADFHDNQDRRYATAAAEASAQHGKPVLVATDLAITDRDYGNPGTVTLREAGKTAFPSGHRAITALAHMVRYAQYRNTP